VHSLPSTADVVIVGGGVIGVSIAYHLARMGAGKVVLLERSQLAAGATGLSSGLVRMHYDNPLEAEMAFKSLPAFRDFDDVIGGDCGFVPNPFVRTVQPGNLDALRANVAMLQELGVDTRLLERVELAEMAPYLAADDIPLAAYEPASGYADPHLTTTGFARAARRHGARIAQGVEVRGIEREGGRVTAVQTPAGRIETGVVINAAGPWGGLVAAMAGISVDVTAIRHQVAIVETPAAVPWPHLIVIDGLHNTYFRPETGRLTLVGASHDNQVISTDRLDDYGEGLDPGARYRVLEHLCARVPAMATGGVRKGHAGIYAKTMDGHALLGPAPGLEGFYCAVGFSGHGFKEAPVVGQAMAELILDGRAEVVDIAPLRLTRFEEGEPYHGPHPYQGSFPFS